MENIRAAVRDLLTQKPWYEWPKARNLSADEFVELTLSDIEHMLSRCAPYDFDFEQVSMKLWHYLRG